MNNLSPEGLEQAYDIFDDITGISGAIVSEAMQKAIETYLPYHIPGVGKMVETQHLGILMPEGLEAAHKIYNEEIFLALKDATGRDPLAAAIAAYLSYHSEDILDMVGQLNNKAFEAANSAYIDEMCEAGQATEVNTFALRRGIATYLLNHSEDTVAPDGGLFYLTPIAYTNLKAQAAMTKELIQALQTAHMLTAGGAKTIIRLALKKVGITPTGRGSE